MNPEQAKVDLQMGKQFAKAETESLLSTTPYKMNDLIRTVEVNAKFVNGMFKSIKVQDYGDEITIINRNGNALTLPKGAILDVNTLVNIVSLIDNGL